MADTTLNFAGNKPGSDRFGSRNYNQFPVTRKEFKDYVKAADTDKNGTVTAEEVNQYIEKNKDRIGDIGIAVMNMLNKQMKQNKSDSLDPTSMALLELREFGPKFEPDPIILK
jgi:hypothetical protein